MYVIVVGGGNTGSYLTRLLLEGGQRVMIVEERPSVLEKLKLELPGESILEGDGSSPDVLERAQVSRANVLAAVTGSDETNLVITSLARFEFNVPRVIARVNNPKNTWLFNAEMGVDVALNLFLSLALSHLQGVRRLQVHPKCGRSTEIAGQPKGRVGGDAGPHPSRVQPGFG